MTILSRACGSDAVLSGAGRMLTCTNCLTGGVAGTLTNDVVNPCAVACLGHFSKYSANVGIAGERKSKCGAQTMLKIKGTSGCRTNDHVAAAVAGTWLAATVGLN